MIRGFDSPIIPILWYYPDGTQCSTEHELLSVRDGDGDVVGLKCETTGREVHSILREVERLRSLVLTPDQVKRLVEQEIQAFPLSEWGIKQDPTGWSFSWVPLLAERIAKVIAKPSMLPEGAQTGQDGDTTFVALQHTGANSQTVKDFLGDAYEGLRGGVSDDDPIVIFFTARTPFTVSGTPACEVSPTDWIIKFIDSSGAEYLTSLSHKDYQRLYGR